jgi:hypothetical protein
MSTKAKLKLITIVEAENTLKNNDNRLFVLNRTKDPAGNINMTVVGDDGRPTTVVIPLTFIPFDMSNYISKGTLLKAPQFRRLVAAGAVCLVDSHEAEKFFKNSERAQKEERRLLNTFGMDHDLREEFVEIDDMGPKKIKVEHTVEANPFIMAIIDRENTEFAGDLITELESRQHTLERADIEYLLANTKQAAIKSWAADALTDME